MAVPVELSVADTFGIRPTLLRRQSPDSFVREFKFTVEPYVGCAFGCRYCFVPMKSSVGRLPGLEAWGRWYDTLDRSQIDEELARHSGDIRGAWLYMAGETDAWQPMEGRHQTTRYVLQRLADQDFDRMLLSTRSTLILRDIDLLRKLSGRVSVGISIPTDVDRVRRIAEPTAPSIQSRFETARVLKAAGVRVRINIAPLLPYSDDFARTLLTVVDRVWIDVPDPSTPHWRQMCDQLRWPAGLDKGTYRQFYECMRDRLGSDRAGFGRSDFAAGV